MKKTLLTLLLLAGAMMTSAFATGANGAGKYDSKTCDCTGVASGGGAVNFAFNFAVSSKGGCEKASGTVLLSDPGCRIDRLKGRVMRVEFFDITTPTAAVHGVITAGPLKGKPFRLKIYPDSFTFHIVSGPCDSDCPGYFTSGTGLPPGMINFVP